MENNINNAKVLNYIINLGSILIRPKMLSFNYWSFFCRNFSFVKFVAKYRCYNSRS